MGNVDGRVNSGMIHGNDSEFLKKIKTRLDLSPLSGVEKMQIEGMVTSMVARGIAFDVEMYINQILIQQIKSTHPDIINYESDLYSTQSKITELEQNMQFHKVAMNELKQEYMDTKDSALLTQIDEREEAILKSQRLYNSMMELRNKIRKEVDKRDVMKKQTELKEKEFNKTVIDTGDLDMSE